MSGTDLSTATVDPAAPIGGSEIRAYADAPNRLVGYLVDATLLTVLSFLGAIVISLSFGPVVTVDIGAASQVAVDRELALANAVLGTALSLVYFVVSWRSLGGSPGQRLLRMRVFGLDGPVSLGRWVLRWAFLGIPVAVAGAVSAVAPGWVVLVTTIFIGIWFALLLASIARSDTKQGWLDRAVRTIVVKEARSVPTAEPVEGSGARVH
ncbi:MAG: RDD family protein [Actinomycetota bacterium]